MPPIIYRFATLTADPWSRRQNYLDNMQNTNTNTVFPTPESVMKGAFFSAPQTRKLKISLLQHNNLSLLIGFECLGFWWEFLPRDIACVMCACLGEFLFNVSRQHSMSTSVLQANPNESRDKLVVLETVNISGWMEGRGLKKQHWEFQAPNTSLGNSVMVTFGMTKVTFF